MEGKTKAEIKAKSQSQSQRRRCHNASQTGTRSRAMKWSQCEELPLVTKWVIRKWGLMRKVRPRMTQIHWDSILKSKDITLPTKVHLVKTMVFPVVMLWMWELDYKENWPPKNWCFQTVALEKTFESPLDYKEIQPVHPKGNQSWIFIGRTDAKAEALIPWPPDANNWLIEKDPNVGKDWGQEEKGMTEDEMIGWHHQLNGHEFE